MSRQVTKLKSIVPADGWFEVRGTLDNPSFARLALWAHVKVKWEEAEGGEDDLVVGISADEAMLVARDYVVNDSPVGYLHAEDLERIKGGDRTPLEKLDWE
ncbi:MAG TPA: hypothetical protein VHD15_00775 [Hyphomicrobiales bacterium]|nr:hypothetical protein [Hyphomicrobiales bacterium]